MPGGGLMQLVAYGAQDVYFNPQRTFFGTPVKTSINRHADLISSVELRIGDTVVDRIHEDDLRIWDELRHDVPQIETFDTKFDKLHTKHGTLEDECSICLENPPGMITTTDCGHKFHTDCIKGWLRDNPSCPLCRAGFG